MASFCTKCGATVTPDTQFCITCGAPVGTGVDSVAGQIGQTGPTSPVVPPYGQPYSQPYVQPLAAPPSSGGSAVKIILIIVAVFIGLGILGAGIFAFTVWRVARAVHVEGSGDKVTINTPGGTLTANQGETFSASDLGTDPYPGAQTGHGSMRMDLPGGSMVTAVYVTPDSKEQVLNFYKSKLGSGASVIDTSNGAIVTLSKGQQESVMVTITANSSQYDGKTQVAIVHSKNNKAS